jgi:hypothetical protein
VAVDLNELSLSDKIIGGAGILLFIDLLFLPWHSVDLGIATYTRSGIESPGGIWGLLALLLTIALVLYTLLPKLATVEMPDLPVKRGEAIFYGAIAVLALLLIKLITETDYLGFGCYLAILLGAALVYGGYLVRGDESDAPASGGGAAPF